MTSSSFNWVEARSKCTTFACFELLAEQVRSDVDSVGVLNAKSNVRWGYERHNWKIIVYRTVDSFPDYSIVFTSSNEAITVEHVVNGNRTKLFQSIPHLLDDRTCKLEINDVPVAIWQVSRKALDGLFFGV